MMKTPGAAGKGAAGETKTAGPRATRSSKPAYERAENLTGQAGTSSTPPAPTRLQAAITRLAVLVIPSAELALTQAQLEEQRQ
jgi:hypothetical protein